MHAIFLTTVFNGNISAFATESDTSLEHAEQRATIDKNFEDNVVVVVLAPKISKIHNAKFFDGIEIESIKDLTKREKTLCHGIKMSSSKFCKFI